MPNTKTTPYPLPWKDKSGRIVPDYIIRSVAAKLMGNGRKPQPKRCPDCGTLYSTSRAMSNATTCCQLAYREHRAINV